MLKRGESSQQTQATHWFIDRFAVLARHAESIETSNKRSELRLDELVQHRVARSNQDSSAKIITAQ